MSNWDLPEHVPLIMVLPVTPELRADRCIADGASQVIVEVADGRMDVLSTDLDCPNGIVPAALRWAEACGAAYAGMAVR